MNTKDNILERAAVGRIAKIGDLYDACTDTFTNCSALQPSPLNYFKCKTLARPFHKFFPETELSDIYKVVGIDADLRLSIMTGSALIDGPVKAVCDSNSDDQLIRSFLVQVFEANKKMIDFSHQFFNTVQFEPITDSNATHVIVGIVYGTITIIAVENKKSNELSTDEIYCNQLVALGHIMGQAKYENDQLPAISVSQPIMFKVYFDESKELLCTESFDSVLKILKEMRDPINDSIPLKYYLMPLSLWFQNCKQSCMSSLKRYVPQIDKNEKDIIEKLFDDVYKHKQQLSALSNTLQSDCRTDNFVVDETYCEKINAALSSLKGFEKALKNDFAKILCQDRNGELTRGDINIECEKKTKCLENATIEIADCLFVEEKLELAQLVTKHNGFYVGLSVPSQSVEAMINASSTYVLAFNKQQRNANNDSWKEQKSMFLWMLTSPNTHALIAEDKSNGNYQNFDKTKTDFIAVDLDAPEAGKVFESLPQNCGIFKFEDGRCVDNDVFSSYRIKHSLNFAKSTKYSRESEKPPASVEFCTLCVCQSADENGKIRKWICPWCFEKLQYGFKSFLYCSCGRASLDSFQFKCCDQNHGNNYVSFADAFMKQCVGQIHPREEINILLLGATGVGKSTWINSIVNYLRFPDLKDALNGNEITVIPSRFYISDDNYQSHEVRTIGFDENEDWIDGHSSTQASRPYIIKYKNKIVRLIDTPGVGDTRGIEKDKENFANILNILNNYDKLHGICILLKPNESRLNTMFRFCIKELLCNLHQSAIKNIVFCFTHSRGGNYRPGQTLPVLEAFLKEQKLSIPLNKETMYCMDNESFSFLVASHRQKQFDEDYREQMSLSWKNSHKETLRLIDYVFALKPHQLKDTLSLNEARHIITVLQKPLATVSRNIQDNIAEVKKGKAEMETFKGNREELVKHLEIKKLRSVSKALEYPRIVCNDCAKSKTGEYEFCKEHTKFWSKLFFSFRKWGIRSKTNCWQCSCSNSFHSLQETKESNEVYYETDQSVKNLIAKQKTDEELLSAHLKALEAQVKALQNEQNIIKQSCVLFCCFLKEHALSSYNDVVDEYIQCLIEVEKGKPVINKKEINRLNSLREMHQQEVQLHQEAKDEKINTSLEEIKNCLQKLYDLPIKGSEIKQHVAVKLECKAKNIKSYEVNCERIHNNWIPNWRSWNRFQVHWNWI